MEVSDQFQFKVLIWFWSSLFLNSFTYFHASVTPCQKQALQISMDSKEGLLREALVFSKTALPSLELYLDNWCFRKVS